MSPNVLVKVLVVLSLAELSCAQPELGKRCRPDNWSHCYTLYGDPTTDFTWYQADGFCKNISQHLVSIPDKQTENLLISMLREAPTTISYAWTVGQASNDTTWRTIDGSIYTGYVSASRDTEACGSLQQRIKPSNGDTRELAMVLSGQVCNFGRHPLCQVPRDGHCLYNEIPIPPFCYRLLDHSASWFDAEVKCADYAPGAHLAYTHIDDVQFRETLMKDQAISLGETCWVGIYMRPWIWRLNECAIEKRNMLYSNWNYVSHPPLGSTPEGLGINTNTGLWQDFTLTTKMDYFICEEDDDASHGHELDVNCPTPDPEALPTIPLALPTTAAPGNDTMDDDSTAKAKDLSIAALVLAVISVFVAIVCLIAVCHAVKRFKRTLEKAKTAQATQSRNPAARYTNNDEMPRGQVNGANTNVWYHAGNAN